MSERTRPPETTFTDLTDDELESLWRENLDWADANDDYGGHVGISRHYRRTARSIEDERRRRRLAVGEGNTP